MSINLAVVGSGPSSLYLIKHIADAVKQGNLAVAKILIFEKNRTLGTGMPYCPTTTDRFNICNITSDELPQLSVSFVDWLYSLDAAELARHQIDREKINSDSTYSRLAMGEYFSDQWAAQVARLRELNIQVVQFPSTEVVDIHDCPMDDQVELKDFIGRTYQVDRVVIATGHRFDTPDDPDNGFYASPWPIHKLLPRDGQLHNFTIGILGASLSAYDVVTSLAHRHGCFSANDEAGISFQPYAHLDKFKIVLHDAHGWLPHLQYEQEHSFRRIERHVDTEDLQRLRDSKGFLRLDDYFDRVCRPALQEALAKDDRTDWVDQLSDPSFGLQDFVEKMQFEHTYEDAFEGMKRELPEALDSLKRDRPIHWKEVLDDLMYALNFVSHWMPAEDHIRFHRDIMPFLMNVIAAMPLQSARTLLALHQAGCLELQKGRVTIGEKSNGYTSIEIWSTEEQKTTVGYPLFIVCGGQGVVSADDFPFPALVQQGSVRAAQVAFADARAVADIGDAQQDKIQRTNQQVFYAVGGIDIDCQYRVIGNDGQANDRIYDVAFPHAAGLRPYSYGLQACDLIASRVSQSLCRSMPLSE